MSNWREAILREFQPEVARLTLVADPDGLLLEEGVLHGLENRGFELISFDDSIAFRYAYESRYRTRWDRGEATELVVVLRSPESDIGSLPYDLIQAGRSLSFHLGELFPWLSLPVVGALDRSDLDALYEAQARERLDRPLSRRQTEAFVLRHVFGIAPETIRSTSDLLRFLLERHYKGMRIPASLDERLVSDLRENAAFRDWPLEVILPDREGFFRFVQERWPMFLNRIAARSDTGKETRATYGLEFSGPEDLPFDHDDVRVYLDNLFLEGFLDPISHEKAEEFKESWASVGVLIDADADHRRRWEGLLSTVSSSLPDDGAGHAAWRAFALRWARLVAMRNGMGAAADPEEIADFEALRARTDEAFLRWLDDRYRTLHNQPPVPPVMVHHLPRHMARRLSEKGGKVALVVIDGLSLDQWVVVRESLGKQDLEVAFHEDAVFAWIPTLTPVSRQSCFAGSPPLYFPRSIENTSQEATLWKRFWEEEGMSPHEVGYERALRGSADLQRIENLLDHPRTRVVGLVVDQVDRMMHGMQLGAAGMQGQVRLWSDDGFLARLLGMLVERNYTVFLTADHGNVEARGCGRPGEGSVADVRGERVRVFPDEILRARVQEGFPGSIAWSSAGLPDGYFPLLAPGRDAFVREGETVVGHGGATLEEVIVPFIEIEAG